jgi:flagellar M-ring protein FliF
LAVLVDHVPRARAGSKTNEIEMVPLSAEELQKVEALVREAVGFNAARGDSVAVQNAAFVQSEIPLIEELPLWQQPQAVSYARQGLGLALVLGLVLMVLRPALKSLMAPQGGETALAAVVTDETRALADDRVDLQAAASLQQQGHYDRKLQAARQAVVQDPKRVAQVVKTWVGQEV